MRTWAMSFDKHKDKKKNKERRNRAEERRTNEDRIVANAPRSPLSALPFSTHISLSSNSLNTISGDLR